MFQRLLCALVVAVCAYATIHLIPDSGNDYVVVGLLDRTASVSEQFDDAKSGLVQLIDALPRGMRLGILDVDDNPSVLFEGDLTEADRAQVREVIQNLTVAETGGTDLPTAFEKAGRLAQQMTHPNPQVIILALTDGQTKVGDSAAAEARLASLQFPAETTVIFIGLTDPDNSLAQQLGKPAADVQLVGFDAREMAISTIATAINTTPDPLQHPGMKYGLPAGAGFLLYLILSLVPWPAPASRQNILTIHGEGIDEQTFLLPSGTVIEVGGGVFADCPIDGLESSVRFSQEDGKLIVEPSDENLSIAVRLADETKPLTTRSVFDPNRPVNMVFDDTITLTVTLN